MDAGGLWLVCCTFDGFRFPNSAPGQMCPTGGTLEGVTPVAVTSGEMVQAPDVH